jgi:hypothetical protein
MKAKERKEKLLFMEQKGDVVVEKKFTIHKKIVFYFNSIRFCWKPAFKTYFVLN